MRQGASEGLPAGDGAPPQLAEEGEPFLFDVMGSSAPYRERLTELDLLLLELLPSVADVGSRARV